jgi:prepilin-type N-terminal cleavage/methylation domain-containing protein
MHSPAARPSSSQRGSTLAELMVALVVLSIGILAVARVFPAGTRSQVQSRVTSTANYYVQDKLEELSGKTWTDAALTGGRHPAAGFDTLGTHGTWRRMYQVDQMAAPLDNLKKVTVTVNYTVQGARSVASTTYMRR